MNSSGYAELWRLVNEYEEDVKIIRPDKMIILNYPKLFTMSAASSFEHQIKTLLADFIQYPCRPISTSFPQIQVLARRNGGKPLEDKMFAKLEGFENGGIPVLNAGKFYDLFGGQVFKDDVATNFEIERRRRIFLEEALIDKLVELLGQGDQYERDYAKHSDIKERLSLCTFDNAEKAYLTLKMKRNRVAHNYVYGLSDSFEDIRNFYYDAILYVVGLEKAIENVTNLPR